MPPTSTLRSIPVIHVRVADSFNAMVASCFMAIGSKTNQKQWCGWETLQKKFQILLPMFHIHIN